MKNEFDTIDTQYVIHIPTTRGEITIDCPCGIQSIGYHYKPRDKMDPFYNGPINPNDPSRIEEALERSWIDPTPENVKAIIFHFFC